VKILLTFFAPSLLGLSLIAMPADDHPSSSGLLDFNIERMQFSRADMLRMQRKMQRWQQQFKHHTLSFTQQMNGYGVDLRTGYHQIKSFSTEQTIDAKMGVATRQVQASQKPI